MFTLYLFRYLFLILLKMSTICKILLIQHNCNVFIWSMYYVQLIVSANKMEIIVRFLWLLYVSI